MKHTTIHRVIVFLLAVMVSFVSLHAQRKLKNIEVDKIKYALYSDRTAVLSYGEGAKGDIVIPEMVTYKGIDYKVTGVGAYAFVNIKTLTKVVIPSSVTSIGASAFWGCSALTEVVIPNSVTSIGAHAFMDCKALTDITLPDKYPQMGENVFGKPYGYDNCDKITSVKGNTQSYPPYLEEVLPRYCPFIKEVLPSLQRQSFDYFAKSKILTRVEAWQKKKEFETTSQWKERVTDENRQEFLAKTIAELKQKFIASKKPRTLTLGLFDADHGVFPVTAEGIEKTFHISVPNAEAQRLKENWSKAIVTPEYGVVNDRLAILSCKCEFEGKTYYSLKNYSQEDGADVAINLPPLELDLGDVADSQSKQQPVHTAPSVSQIDKSLDTDIPQTNTRNDKTFAVIIGNENYSRVSKVDFALNDAKVFAEYCKKTLGLPEKNVRSYKDATFGTMLAAMDDIAQIASAYDGDLNVIFYYAGHGVPDAATHNAFLLPVDVDGRMTNLCLSTEQLYTRLKELDARNVVVFLDACFSGAERGEGMLASARGVALKVKSSTPKGNMVVFSAATGDQTAYPYKEKGHGMFTYFILKKLQETKGEATLGELDEYVSTEVSRRSVVENGKSQTPILTPSTNLGEDWKSWKLK